MRLFTGDILAIASSEGRVFTAGADGSLRSWTITRAGELQEGPCRERSHEGRVSACVIADGRVFTVSYDGSVKVCPTCSFRCWGHAQAACLESAYPTS